MKHRWIGKVEPDRVPADEFAALARLVMPGVDPKQLRPMTGGFRNWNYRVDSTSGPRVLRVYAKGDRSALKERRLAELVAPDVVAPKVLEIAELGDRMAAVREFAEGTVLHELLETPGALDRDVAHCVGRTLAAVHRIEFDEYGELDADLRLTERYDLRGIGIVAYVRGMLATGTAGERLGPALADQLLVTLERCAELLEAWRERPVLVHGDFGPTNLVLGPDGSVAVLDWEFGCSAVPALDFGNLLRPPLANDSAFVQGLAAGYESGGGHLPEDWRRLALLADVMAWVTFAARPNVHDLVLADARDRIQHTIREFSSDRSGR